MTAAELLARQAELQSEAAAVATDLELDQRLAAFGTPVRVGSAALGVMVRRDLDVTVICPEIAGPTRSAIAALGAELTGHERVRQVLIRDDTGAWNTDRRYPDGMYLGVRYRSSQGADWNLDLWFVDEPDRQPDLAHLRDLRPALDEERRIAVLAIKSARAGLPADRVRGSSFDVYRAVVEGAVTTLDEFDRWLAAQR